MIRPRALGVAGRGPGLLGVGSRDNRKRDFLPTGCIGNSSESFAEKRSREMQEWLKRGCEVKRKSLKRIFFKLREITV